MKTQFILLSCCHCDKTANWQPVVDAIPCICWGIIGLIALFLILKYLIIPAMTQCHETKMKEKMFQNEEFWYNKKNAEKEKEINREIKEFQELTVNQKLLDKVINKKLDEEITDLKQAFEDMKNKYNTLSGEIEHIIIKKKQ